MNSMHCTCRTPGSCQQLQVCAKIQIYRGRWNRRCLQFRCCFSQV